MPRRQTILYDTSLGATGKLKAVSASYFLATTQDAMQFIASMSRQSREARASGSSLILDRTRLLGAGDKATAKTWAKRLGLKSWTYVRV